MLGRVTHRTTHGNELLIHHSSALFNPEATAAMGMGPVASLAGSPIGAGCADGSLTRVVRRIAPPVICAPDSFRAMLISTRHRPIILRPGTAKSPNRASADITCLHA